MFIQIFGNLEFLFDYLELVLEGLVQTFIFEVFRFETAGALTASIELALGSISGAIEVAEQGADTHVAEEQIVTALVVDGFIVLGVASHQPFGALGFEGLPSA